MKEAILAGAVFLVVLGSGGCSRAPRRVEPNVDVEGRPFFPKDKVPSLADLQDAREDHKSK
jgi:hypothetical protein